jgi:hypothetical protein
LALAYSTAAEMTDVKQRDASIGKIIEVSPPCNVLAC